MSSPVCTTNQTAGCPSCGTCQAPSDGTDRNSGAVIRLSVSLLVFLAAIVFRRQLAAEPTGTALYAAFLIPYLLTGYKVLFTALRNILHGRVFDENFLMSIATFGALALGEPAEAAAVMLFYTTGETLQEKAASSARRSISALTDLRPDTALLLPGNGGEAVQTDPVTVPAGSLILIRPGARIPLDGTVVSGSSFLDTSALTGESVPVRIAEGEAALAGSVNGGGMLTLRTTAEYGDTSLARIIRLVEEASERKAPTERFISRFAKVYTPAVVAAALLIAFIPPLLLPGALFTEWIHRALILLVISCPCALVISIPLGYFGGIGGASRSGILIKGANYLETLAELHTVVFDKTGTLTEGVFEVTSVRTFGAASKKEVLQAAAQAETHSSHPIAAAIRRAAGSIPGITTFEEFPGKGVRAGFNGTVLLAGNRRHMEDHGISVITPDDNGGIPETGSTLHIGRDLEHIGTITISDRIKPSVKGLMKELRGQGVKRTVMLTGDSETAAAHTAELAGVDSYHASLLPEGKLEILEKLMAAVPRAGKTAFAGDGINDAPVLGRADVGIAMGALGSDAAIEAADVVIMDDQPVKIGKAIEGARKTRRIVLQNISMALGIKGIVMLLGVFGLANMWMAIFADVGVALLAILNSTRALRAFR
jgi:Cd2+/Zn2+-exporting ATPase